MQDRRGAERIFHEKSGVATHIQSPMRPLSLVFPLLACALGVAFLAPPEPLAGQETGASGGDEAACETGRISYVFIDNQSVFDADDLAGESRFRWAYRLANTLHMRTSRDFIADELLFAAGDCYDPLVLEESERLLRNYGFIARADVYGIRQPDDSWHVLVDTQDEWTTKVNVNASFDGGFQIRGIDVTEENVLGEGLTAGVFFRQRDERRDMGARFFSPQLFGTRLDGSLAVGRTRVGNFFEQSFFYPFVGELGRVAGRQLYSRREELFPYRIPRSGDILLLPIDAERLEVVVAGRIGDPGNLTVFGLGVSNETLDFPDFPGGVELAPDGDFGRLETAPDTLAEPLRVHTLHSSATRLNVLFGQRNVRFLQRRGLDALTGQQDVPVGFELGLTVGRSLHALSTGVDQPDDLYTRVRLFGGAASGPLLLNGYAALEGRQIFSGGDAGDGWRDLLAEADAFVYWQPEALPGHTLFLRAAGAGGWDVGLPYQLTLGGVSGVRGYNEDRLPGGRRLVFSAEDRIYVRWPAPDLFDMGFTVFADAGRMWAGGVPYGSDSGWRGAVGAGLRVGFPTGTRGVVRLDAAFPLEEGAGFGDVVLRVSLTDVLGLTGDIEDEQLRRSRRITVGPDIFAPRRRN